MVLTSKSSKEVNCIRYIKFKYRTIHFLEDDYYTNLFYTLLKDARLLKLLLPEG